MIGRGKDGNIRLLLDKKSPTTVAAWQQRCHHGPQRALAAHVFDGLLTRDAGGCTHRGCRWCVFTPEGKLYYFATKQQEAECRVNAAGMVMFEECTILLARDSCID